MSDRSFGNEIGNTTMTASNSNEIADVSLVKNNGNATSQMEKTENGAGSSRLPRPLAIEVYTKVHNCTLSKDDLLDDLEDLFDETYYPGEKLLSGAKEFTVVSSEKRGGLTTYTMDDGTKIGHRDLRRKKGLSIEDIKQIALEDAELIDGKTWKVKESLLKEYPIRETKKFAAIFTKSSSSAKRAAPESSDSESEEKKEENGKESTSTENENSETPRGRAPRASGTPANRKMAEKQRAKEEKEKKDKEKAEKKEREKAEKMKKKEEEKAKKQEEKEKKQGGKKNGTMDKFVKKSETNGNGSSAFFSPTKWGERRVAAGVKKLEEAWKKRDQETFQEACVWCEKNLSGAQQKMIENPIFKFAVQKMVDKSKDKVQMKGMKWAKKAEYRAEMAEKRKDTYKQFEPQIKAWFSDDVSQDDLLLVNTRLELADAVRIECDEEMLKCLELTQFFVSMRKILLWNDNISAEQLRADLHNGLIGFERSTYKMIANLLETALGEKEHEKTAHCNARLSEFPITAHTITELVRAFFLDKTEMSYKSDSSRRNGAPGGAVADEHEEIEDVDSEEKKVEPEEVEPKEEKEGEEDNDEEESDSDSDEEERERQRILTLFSDNVHIYEWPAEKQLDILYAMKETVHNLPIIKEWFLRDANSDQLTGLKQKANEIGKQIEKNTQLLADLPSGEISEEMSRQETREMEKVQKKRQALEKVLDELKDELEENREEAARERDDLERIFRTVSIGSDRHLRKYYWFAYSADAGIWVQDFGTTNYERFVLECLEKGMADVEDPSTPEMPEYSDLPLPTNSSEVWYKLCSEKAIRALVGSLKKNGRREKGLRKYLSNNMDDILASIKSLAPAAPGAAKTEQIAVQEDSRENSPETDAEEPKEQEEEEKMETEEKEEKEAPEPKNAPEELAEPPSSKFSGGPFGSLKSVMSELLVDWQNSGISKIADIPMFETRMDDAKTLDEMKVLVAELANSVPTEVLIEKFPQHIAIAKKCFSHLKIHRFLRRIQEATNASCLHMLLAYFDARIDSKRTLPEQPCTICRRKNGTNRKLMCKQCTTVYHNSCHKPAINFQQLDEEGFKESWWCAKCVKEERRRVLAEKKKKEEENEEENGGGNSGGSSDEEEEEIIDEEENPRGRSAKRKANMAMRDVLEFEGVLRKDQPQAPPPPKKSRKEPLPEVRRQFEAIEKENPRLYKVLQMVPSASRSTRHSYHETRSLADIEEDLGDYKSVELLREHLASFFQQARGYVETHNPRKLDELDSLVSKLDLM